MKKIQFSHRGPWVAALALAVAFFGSRRQPDLKECWNAQLLAPEVGIQHERQRGGERQSGRERGDGGVVEERATEKPRVEAIEAEFRDHLWV